MLQKFVLIVDYRLKLLTLLATCSINIRPNEFYTLIAKCDGVTEMTE